MGASQAGLLIFLAHVLPQFTLLSPVVYLSWLQMTFSLTKNQPHSKEQNLKTLVVLKKSSKKVKFQNLENVNNVEICFHSEGNGLHLDI